MKPIRVVEAAVYAPDLEAAERFYTEVLGLDCFAYVEGRHAFFRCENAVFLVFDPAGTENQSPGDNIPSHGARGPGHVAFSMADDEIGTWKERLAGHGVPIESDYTWPNGGRSLYFRDPAGNSIEFVTPRIWNLPE